MLNCLSLNKLADPTSVQATLERNNTGHLSNTLVDSDHFVAGVHVHFHRIADKTPAGGLIRFDGIIREEIEHLLALVFWHDKLKRKKARPVIVRI